MAGELLLGGLAGLVGLGIVIVARRSQPRLARIVMYVIAFPFVCFAVGAFVNVFGK